MAHASAGGIVPVSHLPAPFRAVFTFRYFNAVQSETFSVAYGTRTNMVVAAPTGSGKTGVLELAILNTLSNRLQQNGGTFPASVRLRTIYLAPSKALVQEKVKEWQHRLGSSLGLRVEELTGDSDSMQDIGRTEDADIICTTPEKFDSMTRRRIDQGGARFLGEVSLVLIDEVHLLNESRGASLEGGVVSRIKMIGALPSMHELPVASVRYVAISATIQNVEDIAEWLGAPPQGIFAFGEEVRPAKLTTIVKGFPTTTADFLFERRLNSHLTGIIKQYSNGLPTLVFCSSRKGTEETSSCLLSSGVSHGYMGTNAQRAALADAAAHLENRSLAHAVCSGIAFHHGNLCAGDRALVEALFLNRAIAVLCTTSTLAQGVNLPAHLVVLKGTRRWVGDKGDVPGNKEYDRSTILQMIGRAGRPQFDDEGVAVLMTQKEMEPLYKNLTSGTEVVESQLGESFAEYLNAEIALRNIVDMEGARHWLSSTFLFVRARKDPTKYGLPNSAVDIGAILERKYIMRFMKELSQHGLVKLVDESQGLGRLVQPLLPGLLMAEMYIRLETMVSLIRVQSGASMPVLLQLLAGAQEFHSICLRRSEKKVLNTLNKNAACVRYSVENPAKPGKATPRIKTAAEKIFILVNEGLSDNPTNTLDFSMKQELEQIIRVGARIAACMAKLFAHKQALAATANAILLQKCLKQRIWDNSGVECMQLQGVGDKTSKLLAAAKLSKLRQLDAADPRKIEAVTQRKYPFGDTLKQQLHSIMPPQMNLSISATGWRPGGLLSFEVRVSRLTAPEHSTNSRAILIVGSVHDDVLLAHESFTLEQFPSPLILSLSTRSAPAGQAATSVVASIILSRYMGLDITRKLSLPWNAPLQHTAGLWAAEPPVEVNQDSLAAESAASPQSKASHVSSLPIVAPKQESELDCAVYSAANDPENALTPSKKDNQIQNIQNVRRMGRQQKSSQSQEEQRMPFRSTQTHMTPQQKQPAQCAKAMGLDNPFSLFTYSDAEHGNASRRTALASTSGQRSPPEEPLREIIRFKARKLRDQKDILLSCASLLRETGHLASQKVSPQQLPAARLLSCSSAPLLSPSAQHSYFSQGSAAGAGRTHEGTPAACTSEKEVYTGRVLVQQLGAEKIKVGAMQPSTSGVCTEAASAACEARRSGAQSRPNLESRQNLEHITDASASMLSPAVQIVSMASSPVKRRQRLVPFLPIVEFSAANAVGSSVAQENKSSTSKQQTGVNADSTACRSIFSFL